MRKGENFGTAINSHHQTVLQDRQIDDNYAYGIENDSRGYYSISSLYPLNQNSKESKASEYSSIPDERSWSMTHNSVSLPAHYKFVQATNKRADNVRPGFEDNGSNNQR